MLRLNSSRQSQSAIRTYMYTVDREKNIVGQKFKIVLIYPTETEKVSIDIIKGMNQHFINLFNQSISSYVDTGVINQHETNYYQTIFKQFFSENSIFDGMRGDNTLSHLDTLVHNIKHFDIFLDKQGLPDDLYRPVKCCYFIKLSMYIEYRWTCAAA